MIAIQNSPVVPLSLEFCGLYCVCLYCWVFELFVFVLCPLLNCQLLNCSPDGDRFIIVSLKPMAPQCSYCVKRRRRRAGAAEENVYCDVE